MTFHEKLIVELTRLDMKESKKKSWNQFALALYIKAAKNVTDSLSFSEAFNPTQGMHTVAQKLKLNLDVAQGNWIKKEN